MKELIKLVQSATTITISGYDVEARLTDIEVASTSVASLKQGQQLTQRRSTVGTKVSPAVKKKLIHILTTKPDGETPLFTISNDRDDAVQVMLSEITQQTEEGVIQFTVVKPPSNTT